MLKLLVAGNWKMNGTAADLAEARAVAEAHPSPGCDVLICPPATLISRMAAALDGSSIAVGGQDCHAAASGAHTGDVSAAMLRDAGAGHVILGHSERRADHGETDGDARRKATAAWSAGLTAIVCVGETGPQREAGRTIDVVTEQLAGSLPDGCDGSNTVVAYEPIWAIGTGRTAAEADIAEAHAALRSALTDRFGTAADGVRLLYGGSVKPAGAAGIFTIDHVDGVLVGGASLKAAEFGAIISAAERGRGRS